MDLEKRQTAMLANIALKRVSTNCGGVDDLELEIREYDKSGCLKATYQESCSTSINTGIDIRRPQTQPLWRRFLDIFLPEGYPATVSSDYTRYQVFDSLQAFACTIAGLISSRAVWQGLGVGSIDSTPMMAMLLQVSRECLGKFSTITYAWHAGPIVEAETKAYRLTCDIFRDIAMVLDMTSPLVPAQIRVVQLCAASGLYAASGVAGGSSKSSLSGHFAQANNLGELNAKENSQETVLGLAGMLAGTIICYFIRDQWWAQMWLYFFLALHLFLNWCAVRSVHLRSLNRQRANLVFSELEENDTILSPKEVANRERVFESRAGSVFRWRGRHIIGSCDFGMPLSNMVEIFTRKPLLDRRKCTAESQTPSRDSTRLPDLIELFQDEKYLLYYHVPEPLWNSDSAGRVKVVVVLEDGVKPQDQLKAWFHGLVLAKRLNEQQGGDALILSTANFNNKQRANLRHVVSTLRYVNQVFSGYLERLEENGWDTSIPVLETRSGSRIICQLVQSKD